MLFKTDYNSVFQGETVLVHGYWDLKPRVRNKLAKHLNFKSEQRDLTISPAWLLTGAVPAPLGFIDPGLLFLCLGQFGLVMVYGFITAGESYTTKRPKQPKAEVIRIHNDARWNALRHAFTADEWERFVQELSSDTDACKALSEIVYRYMDKTANLLKQREIAVELEADKEALAIDEELRTAGRGVKHAINAELKRLDEQAREDNAKAKAEAEEIRLGKLRVLEGDIEMAMQDTTEFRLLAEQAKTQAEVEK